MMNTAITARHAISRSHVLGWFANLVSGFRWGLEMRRRYDREIAAGRRPDDEAIRRISGEVDAWLGRRT
jgi:hypothetical protein